MEDFSLELDEGKFQVMKIQGRTASEVVYSV